MSNDEDGHTITLFLKKIGYSGQGSIILVYAGMPTGDTNNDIEGEYLRDVIEELYTPEMLAEYARTGDPMSLARAGLLIPVRVVFNSAFAAPAP